MNPNTPPVQGLSQAFVLSFISTSADNRASGPPSSLSISGESAGRLDPQAGPERHPGRKTDAPLLSIIIPVFNEEDNVVPLAREILDSLEKFRSGIEIIFVDDASTDGTALRITSSGLPKTRLIRHRVNSGQSAAIATGFRHASAEWVATLDGDGQNDPADLAAMLATAMKRQADCVTGVRINRMDTWLRRMSSILANAFRNFITGDQVIDSGCGIRVLRRSSLKEIPVFNGMHRFLPTLMRGQGYFVLEQTVNHRERTRGVSKYGVGNRLWRGIRDCFGIRWYLGRAVPSDRTGSGDDL